MRSKQEKLNEFERHIIKLATQSYLQEWERRIISDEKKGHNSLFGRNYPEMVYVELERKLNLQEV